MLFPHLTIIRLMVKKNAKEFSTVLRQGIVSASLRRARRAKKCSGKAGAMKVCPQKRCSVTFGLRNAGLHSYL